MIKRLKIPVRALGSAVETPALSELAAWAAERAGYGGDLMTFYLMKTIAAEEEVDIPAAGGWFYLERAAAACLPDQPMDALLEDIQAVQSIAGNPWWALPSARSMVRDPGEGDLINFRLFLRTMRDAGVYGHILLSYDPPSPLEAELISGRRIFWHLVRQTTKSLSKVLEFQRDIAILPDMLPILPDLIDSYTIRKVIVIDPGEGDLKAAHELVDADRIMTGGFAPAGRPDYWNELISRSFLPR